MLVCVPPAFSKANAWKKAGLKGEVQFLKQFKKTAVLLGDTSTSIREVETVRVFGDRGHWLGDQNFREDSSTYYGLHPRYNQQGKILQKNQYNPKGTIDFQTLYTYDKNGKLEETQLYNGDKILEQRTRYQYNKTGTRIASYIYGANDSLQEKHSYKFNANGKQVEWNVHNAKGILDPQTIYRYNEENQMIESASYNYAGILYFKTVYTYDKKGAIVSSHSYSLDGTLHSQAAFVYDTSGHRIAETFEEKGRKTKNTYSYDEEGNWIKKMEYENGVPRFILERDLSYHQPYYMHSH